MTQHKEADFRLEPKSQIPMLPLAIQFQLRVSQQKEIIKAVPIARSKGLENRKRGLEWRTQ